MSKSLNGSGKTLVVDRVIELCGNKSNSFSAIKSAMLESNSQLSKDKQQILNEFTIVVDGIKEVTPSESCTLEVKIYCKGNRIYCTDSRAKNSSILIKNDIYNESFIFSDENKFTISISDITENSSEFLCIWYPNLIGDGGDRSTLVKNFTINVGDTTEYGYAPYFSEQQMLTYDSETGVDWKKNKSELLSHLGMCLWARTSDTFDFVRKKYTNWRYFTANEGETLYSPSIELKANPTEFFHYDSVLQLNTDCILVNARRKYTQETIVWTVQNMSVPNDTETLLIRPSDFPRNTNKLEIKVDCGELSDTLILGIIRDGVSYTINIISSNGAVFRNTNINTTLSCQVLRNSEDITDTLEETRFKWKRTTGNNTGDEIWNTSEKALNHKSVAITEADCLGRTVFNCEVDLP